MKLVDQWSAVARRLPADWDSVTLRIRPEQPQELAEAARLLGPMNAGLVGGELAVTVSRFGGASGPQGAERLFGYLDDARVWCELRLDGSIESIEPPPTAAPTVATGSVAETWDRELAALPTDWSDLLCRIEIDSSDELPRTALLCAPLNPTRERDALAFTFRCGRSSGYGVSPAMARRCFERLDEESLPGRVEVLRVVSDTDNVGTQGVSWIVHGRVL